MDFVSQIKDAGIVGMGGAGFPTHVKLDTKQEYFIINAAECEPLIEVDKFLCRNHADMIIEGALLIGKHLEAKHIVIALKEKYVEEIKSLDYAIAKKNANIEIHKMPYFFPAGDEQTMVQHVTGRIVPERCIPSEVGCVVDNVGTVLYVYLASKGKKVSQKLFSVVGEVEKPIIECAPIGTSVRECIEKAKPLIADYSIIIGGPMMGKYLTTDKEIDEAVVTKTFGNVIVLPKDHYLFTRDKKSIDRIKREAKSACIQCKMCSDLCPRRLLGHNIRPHKVMRSLPYMDIINDNKSFEEAFGDAQNCVGCNLCEMYSCPMGLSPKRVNDYMKGELKKRNINVERDLNPEVSKAVDMRKVPTNRLAARLGLSKYYGKHANDLLYIKPKEVFIPFSQHIGKPAVCVKNVGDKVKVNDLLAKADEGLSTNIHSSVDGKVVEINDIGARISCKGE